MPSLEEDAEMAVAVAEFDGGVFSFIAGDARLGEVLELILVLLYRVGSQVTSTRVKAEVAFAKPFPI
jgi:hypothetical protein